MKPSILLVEDDDYIATLLASNLGRSGFLMTAARSAAAAKASLAQQAFDLVLLDLGLPDADGKSLIGAIRQVSDVPVIVLSARQHEEEKVRCLDLGADDYLAKPFGMDELIARIRVALRHASAMRLRNRLYEVGELRIDLQQEQVYLRDEEVHLTPIERKLLLLLARVPGKVVTHRQMLQEVWGPEFVAETHYLRIHMGRLRAKIEAEPAQPRYLRTEPGVGYRLSES